jgi:hypothetical protein
MTATDPPRITSLPDQLDKRVDIGGRSRGGNQMDPAHLLQIIQRMLAGFKLDIAKMRSEGATQAEIDLLLDEFRRGLCA